MRRIFISLAVAALFIGVNVPSFASSEENNDWITQCMEDNKKEGQEVETVMIYCHCMNEAMSESETRSITEWEQANPDTAEACSEKAGWE